MVLEDDFTTSLQNDGDQYFSLHDQYWLISPGSAMDQVRPMSCWINVIPVTLITVIYNIAYFVGVIQLDQNASKTCFKHRV